MCFAWFANALWHRPAIAARVAPIVVPAVESSPCSSFQVRRPKQPTRRTRPFALPAAASCLRRPAVSCPRFLRPPATSPVCALFVSGCSEARHLVGIPRWMIPPEAPKAALATRVSGLARGPADPSPPEPDWFVWYPQQPVFPRACNLGLMVAPTRRRPPAKPVEAGPAEPVALVPCFSERQKASSVPWKPWSAGMLQGS